MISVVYSVILLLLAAVSSQNFEPVSKEIGGTFCQYLVQKSLLPRQHDCGNQTCTRDDWNSATSTHVGSKAVKERYVLSFAHNGFGNQLWEHSVAFMIAESLKARLLVATIPDGLSPNGVLPPNTWKGVTAMERLLRPQFLYENLPTDSPIRALCDNEPFHVADRPFDFRDRNYSEGFRSNLFNIISDPRPRCVKLLGYFQNYPLCEDDVRRLWTAQLTANFTLRPGPSDISIYLRCQPRHYHFNSPEYYQSVLGNTTFDRVWLFQAPECPRKLSNDTSKDGVVTSVIRLLTTKFNATRWPDYNGTDETNLLLHDLAGLIQSSRLVLPVSTWAFWAGFLSNATEIHVNAPPHHSLMSGYGQYVYHNERSQQYYGRYDHAEGGIVYAFGHRTASPTLAPTARPTKARGMPNIVGAKPRVTTGSPVREASGVTSSNPTAGTLPKKNAQVDANTDLLVGDFWSGLGLGVVLGLVGMGLAAYAVGFSTLFEALS